MENLLIPISIIFYFLLVIYAANQAEVGTWPDQTVRGLLYSLAAFIFLIGPFSFQIAMVSVQPGNEELRELLDPSQLAFVATLALIFAVFGYNLVRSEELRAWVGVRIRGYNPTSFVHQAAALLMMLVLTLHIFNFVLNGGIQGVAASLESGGTSFVYSSLFEAVLFIAVGFLGVGYAIRRTMPDTLARLGLTLPTQKDAARGIGAGLLLWGCSYIFAMIWMYLADPQTFAQQTQAVSQLANQINTLPMALFISTTSAVSEEIFMRGALQPVFGIWLTSGFFALLHSQYLFTPTLIFIFGLSLVFGYIRGRFNTTTAIIAHFVYNFAPSVLLLLFGGAG